VIGLLSQRPFGLTPIEPWIISMDVDFFIGASYVFRGFGLILKPGLRRYVAIPLIINFTLFAVLIGYGAGHFNRLLDHFLPGWLGWMEWIFWPLFAAAVLTIVFFGFSLIANLIGAPFNGLLAEAVERQLTGRSPGVEGGLRRMASEFLTSILSEVRKLVYFACWSAPLLLVFLIPPLNLAAPFLWIGFNAWMLALEYTDFPMGNHHIDFRERRARLRERRLLTTGFGCAALVLIAIPFLNFMAMPVSVAAATAMWVERLSALNPRRES
jgi:CysZ protein